MALATANEVITHVPWSGDTPKSPAIAGIDTLAIDVSSTFIKVASDSAMVPSASVEPVSGGSPAATGLSVFSADISHGSLFASCRALSADAARHQIGRAHV